MIFVWTLGDVIGLTLGAVAALYLIYLFLSEAIKRARCKHDGGARETMACDAICNKCGANLGFIGTWREKQRSSGKPS